MSKIYVYLAGPITGCTDGEANDWREAVIDLLEAAPANKIWSHGFVGVSPLRCEPIIGDRYEPQYEDNKFGTPQVIAAKNKMDVARCDLTLAYQPAPYNDPSIGTLQELGWAVGLDKPVILVTDDDYMRENAVIKATVPWRFKYDHGKGFVEAIEVIDGLFGVYS